MSGPLVALYFSGAWLALFGWGVWMETLPQRRLSDEVIELLLLGVAVALCWPAVVIIALGRRFARSGKRATT